MPLLLEIDFHNFNAEGSNIYADGPHEDASYAEDSSCLIALWYTILVGL